MSKIDALLSLYQVKTINELFRIANPAEKCNLSTLNCSTDTNLATEKSIDSIIDDVVGKLEDVVSSDIVTKLSSIKSDLTPKIRGFEDEITNAISDIEVLNVIIDEQKAVIEHLLTEFPNEKLAEFISNYR